MDTPQKIYGIVIGGTYLNTKYPDYGIGEAFIDRNFELKIDFKQAGPKTVLSEKHASQLKQVPADYGNKYKLVKLEDGNPAIIIDSYVNQKGQSIYVVLTGHPAKIVETPQKSSPIEDVSEKSIRLRYAYKCYMQGLSTPRSILLESDHIPSNPKCFRCGTNLMTSIRLACQACEKLVCPDCGTCYCDYQR